MGSTENWKSIYHPSDIHIIMASIEDIKTVGYFQYEYRILHKDGTTLWVHNRGKIVFDEGNL